MNWPSEGLGRDVANRLTGGVSGVVVQAGVVHGDVYVRPVTSPRLGLTRPTVGAVHLHGVIALLVSGLVAAVLIFGPRVLDSNVPDDAPDISAAHVGDCVGTAKGKYGWYVVPCWYRSAAYRVVDIGLRRILGPTNRTTPADAQAFCRNSPGWEATGRVEPAYPDNFTAVTVCLIHN